MHPYWPLFDLRVRTPRVELRPPTDDDLLALVEVASAGIHDPAATPFEIAWTDAKPPVLQRNAFQWWWRQRAELTPESWSIGLMVSEIGADGARTVVGMQDMKAERFPETRTVGTGSWLGGAHQGKGLGKEMRAAVLHFAFAGLGAERAETAAWHDNAASLGVTRSLGYRPTGEREGLRRGRPDRQLTFAMSREDWEARRRDDIVIEGLDACLPMLGLSEG